MEEVLKLKFFDENRTREDVSYETVSPQVIHFLNRFTRSCQKIEKATKRKYQEEGVIFDPQKVYADAVQETLKKMASEVEIAKLHRGLAKYLLNSFKEIYLYNPHHQEIAFKLSKIEVFAKWLSLYSQWIGLISTDPGRIRSMMKEDFMELLSSMPVFLNMAKIKQIRETLQEQLESWKWVMNANNLNELGNGLLGLCRDLKNQEKDEESLTDSETMFHEDIEHLIEKIESLLEFNPQEKTIYSKIEEFKNIDNLNEVDQHVKAFQTSKGYRVFKKKDRELREEILFEFIRVYSKYEGKHPQLDKKVEHIYYMDKVKFDPKDGHFGSRLTCFFYALIWALEENDNEFLKRAKKACKAFKKRTEQRINELSLQKKDKSFFSQKALKDQKECEILSQRCALVNDWLSYLKEDPGTVGEKKSFLETQVNTEGENLTEDEWLGWWGKFLRELSSLLKKIGISSSEAKTAEEEFKEVLDILKGEPSEVVRLGLN